tara:strand:- start:18 stop:248 length:231 start_codon:yes stop_codon:yes gene_type:complete
MQYEVEDYRKKPPTPSWIDWQVPKDKGLDYIGRLAFWTVLIPVVLFGYILAPLPFFIQLVLLDFFIYLQYKNRGDI